jgi:hypothetical protein
MSDVVEILLRIKDGIVNNISFLQSLINIKCEVSNLAINTDLSEIGDIYIDFKDDYENIEEQIEYLKNQTEKINIKLTFSFPLFVYMATIFRSFKSWGLPIGLTVWEKRANIFLYPQRSL